MNTILKRVISLLLCFVMIAGYMPANALAEETGETVTVETTEVTAEKTEAASEETEAPSESTELLAELSEVTDGSDEEEKSEKELKKKEKEAEKAAKKETKPSTEPSTEATEPSTEATEPSTEATEPSTEATEPSVPETTAPQVTEPEETEPEETEPEETEPQDEAWIKYQQALERYEKLIAELEASHKLAMEKEAAAKEEAATEETLPEKTLAEEELPMFATFGLRNANAGIATAAEEPTIYVLAGGDFQEAGDHANSAANVTNILAQVSQKYETMDGFLFIGDYDCETHDDATETANGITALMGAVQGSYSNLNDANSVLVQGNHDYMDSRIDATGGHEFDGYAAYVLNEDDYPNGGGSQSGIQTLANNLKSWLNNKIGEGYSAPIFIVSHLPLAYTPRTVTQGDAKYAKYIFDVLNDAGKNGLNIFFLHGHDHAYGPDNYMGGEAIYLPVGDKICIAEAGSASNWTEETLNFTYMNASYTGYYSDAYTYVTTAGTDKLTMTVFAITDNQVTVERYSEDGLYNLKSAGYDGSYSNTSVTNVSLGLPKYSAVYASPQTVVLTMAEDYGDIGSWVGVKAEITDDVTPENEGWVELIAPVPGTEATPGSTTYQYTLDTDGTVDDGTPHLIVASDAAYAMTGSGSIAAVSVEISDNTITTENRSNEWTITSDGEITNGTYWLTASPGRNSCSIGVSTKQEDAYNWNINHSGSGQYIIYATYTSGNTNRTWYLYYNEGGLMSSAGFTTYRYSEQTLRLYGNRQEITIPGTSATPGTNGVYVKIDGNLTYNATAGMDAEAALNGLKKQVGGYYKAEAMSPDEAVAGNLIDDGSLTWDWIDTFDGNTAGDYEVAIKYGDLLLATAEVVVPAATIYYAAEGNGLYLVDMNTTETNAMAAVKAGVTVYSATDANGSNKQEVTEGVTYEWVDTYNGADSGPYTVEILKDGTSLGTVEVKVDIQYKTEIITDWTFIEETQGSSGGTYYERVENVSELVSGEQYLIIFDCSSQTADDAFVIPTIVTTGSGSSQRKGPDVVASAGITNNATITGNYDNYLWTLTKSGNGWKIGNSSQNINVTMNNTSSRGELSLTTSGEVLTIASGSNNPTDANSYSYAIYDSSNLYWQYNTSATLVYATDGDDYTSRFIFYGVKQGEATPAREVWAKIEGNTVYTVTQGTTALEALNAVKAGITGYTATDANGTGKTEIPDGDLKYTWKNTYNGLVTGSYWVEISYQGKVLGTVVVNVEPGVVNNYPEYPDEGSVKVSKTGTGIDFQSSGIAQVEVSASGVPIKKGADVIIMVDTSSSMNTCITHGTRNCTQSACQGNYRSHVFEKSLTNLIEQLKTPGDDGELMDLRVAIADFNGFDKDTDKYPWSWNPKDIFVDDVEYDATNYGTVYTGSAPNTRNLTATAFSDVADLEDSYSFTYHSGTNYDYAFDVIYQLATAARTSSQEDRDLFVVFMSDGAPMQYNYFHSNGRSDLLQYYLQGQITETSSLRYRYDGQENNSYQTATGYGAFKSGANTAYYHPDGKHWMAEAIKGDPNDDYKVIRKGFATDDDGFTTIKGLGAKMFSIAFCPAVDQHTPVVAMTHVLEGIASEQTGTTKYYYNVSDEAGLANAFTSIGSEIAYAANNARFVDQMGDDFNLQLLPAQYSVVNGTDTSTESLAPKIEIISYDIYTRQDYLDKKCTESQIGDRKGTYTVLETITTQMVEATPGAGSYNKVETKDEDGKVVTVNYEPAEEGNYNLEVYSDQINGGTTNILADGTQAGYVEGVIYAKTFIYNTNITDVAVEGVSIPTGVNADGTTKGSTNNVLPSETFYWKMGTVQTSELAMRYYVYLEGSMEGTKEGGSYPTNEFATLYYDNYLNNPCKKDTVSPVMAWKEANVSYAFYLVDENGNIIVNQTTGQTGSFANKIAVTNPVVYKTVLLNNEGNVQAIKVTDVENSILPLGYELYDSGAEYEVKINSNTTGSWTITKGDGKATTTYVTQYDPNNASAYSNVVKEETIGHDYTHTVVWFAVLWKVQALPDSVVVDYGLPVDISVLTNDMFGENGKLAGVGAYTKNLNLNGHDTTLASGFSTSYTGTYGTAKADASTGKVRYTLNTMEMNGYEKFAYAVNYTASENAGYYYDTVTVIPATTIYYEDNFVDLESYTWDTATNGWKKKDTSLWTIAGTVNTNATQDEDRPGRYSLTDANNIYGYDNVNLSMSEYSLGSAMKATVDYDNKAEASFEFYGTGFDVISMTSNTTGSIYVAVYDANNNRVGTKKMVDTYYGCKQIAGDADGDGVIEDGEVVWVVDPESEDAIYQVPVMKVEKLTYGKYKAVIEVIWEPIYDNVEGSEDYEFYLDAIRIYDPANDGAADGTTDTTIEDAYKADGEGWPSYFELRNYLITENKLTTDDGLGDVTTNTKVTGLVFIDGDAEVGEAQIADYISYGPNNEVYLAPGQRVAFLLDTPEIIANVHLGVKSADGKPASWTITNIAQADNDKVTAGTYYGAKTSVVDTTTDMYYDITGYKGDIIVVSNYNTDTRTEGIISLTNIKFTYSSAPNGTASAAQNEEEGIVVVSNEELTGSGEAYAYMTPAAATLTLRSLNRAAVETPDETVPEESVPETTVPEESVPENTVPETTVPEETVPETTVPEETKDPQQQVEEQIKEVVQTVVNTVKNVLQNLFSKWFR